MKSLYAGITGLLLAGAGAPALAQHVTGAGHPPVHALASHLIVPQARAWTAAAHPSGTVTITGVSVAVDIVEQVATTTLDLLLTNATSRRLEAQLIVPVPDQAALRGFT